jgi:hypothetical protein
MERRDFLKISAATGTTAALSSCGHPEHQCRELMADCYEYEFGRLGQRTSMPWLAALGGLLGGVAGYFLTALTQSAYHLPTGGMPLSPHWTNGIITYELTMLGAILATLGTLAVATHVAGQRSPLADPAVADGKMVVGVRNPPDGGRVEIERALRSAGAESVVCRT